MGHELIFPTLCRSCKLLIPKNRVFCQTCFDKIEPIVSTNFSLTNNHSMVVHALAPYTDPLKRLVLRKKCGDRLASRQLAHLMSERLSIEGDYLVPIPLHWTRYARRGFNQAYEMALVLGEAFDIPVVNLLKRVRRTKYQSSLSHELRQENVENVFAICRMYRDIYRSIVRDKRIIFVDDLCTTGATLKNAAREVLSGKPKSVSAVVACRVV